MHVLIIADIEGGSGCWSRSAAAYMTLAWRRACLDMTKDVRSVVLALKKAGVHQITIHDFHRTGYNIIPQKMPSGCRMISGYKAGPVPGIGDPGDVDLLMLIGMHAPSGSEGFLAHTLTSRVASLQVNGRLLSEAELFSASLYCYGIRPVFFSGCPLACKQAATYLKGILTYPIDKTPGSNQNGFNVNAWRNGLANAAVASLENTTSQAYRLTGPFTVRLQLRDGPSAADRLARRWHLNRKGNALYFDCLTFTELYDRLLSICYLTPLLARHRKAALGLYRLWGYLGHLWIRTLPDRGNI
ncbi:MAG: M55 family metallopeptidase [Desulfobacteraceae bacterium]|jgi:D-aminopeptidase